MARSVSDGTRAVARLRALQRLAVRTGREDFLRRHPSFALPPVVALICAYDEESSLGAVLGQVPEKACGLPVATLVVVDGGDDGTARVAMEGGALTVVLPANLGHGVALRAGYELCVSGGARYVVTLDADGQHDAEALESVLQPLVDDEADVVVASRRLGVDQTTVRSRHLAAVCVTWLVNRLMGSDLTDASSGYRALRATMLADVVTRLEQDQYPTAELLVTALGRGWRVVERPTVWHERSSGASKKGGVLLHGARDVAVVLRTWRRQRAGRRR